MQPINWLKRKVSDITDNRSFSDTIREFMINCKDEIQKTIFKMKHLEESNENLAYYHFDRGNINDSIFRFKIINKIHPRAEYDFFLGRLYWEKNKIEKSVMYIDKYLESGDTKYKKEAEYQQKLTKRQYNQIADIPDFFKIHNLKEFYFTFEKKLKESLDHNVKSPFFDAAFHTINGHFNDRNLKILDIDCGDGVLGNCSKRMLSCEELVGVELLDKLANLASSRKYKDFAIYHRVINDRYSPQLFEEKFDIIFAEDFIKSNIAVDVALNNMKSNLRKDGLIVFAFTATNQSEDHQFLSAVESFAFNEEYIKKVLSACKLKLVDQKKAKYSNDNINTIIIATHED